MKRRREMGMNSAILLLFLLLSGGCSSASATPPAKIVGGAISTVVSTLFKWAWSLKSTTNTASSSRSLMKFEGGYTVETVLDGSKLGIEPYSLDLSPNGELLVLDSQNSNIYQITMPMSRYSRPKLLAGSPEGYSGHVDGRPRESRMNHPKGLTSDDRGNIYVADTKNMAIRKISDTGVVTIAGGKWSHGGHVDGPSEEAKFSNDFNVFYIGSSCSLLVVDRGNQAIREIQLRDDDCSDRHDGDLHLGIAVLAAAGFFGYMLALLQRRVAAMFSFKHAPRASMKAMPSARYQRPLKSSRRPLIPVEDEVDNSEEGLFGLLGRLILNVCSSVVRIFWGLLLGSIKKLVHHQPAQYSNAWPMQESFVIPNEGHMRDAQNYQITTKDQEITCNFKQIWSFYGGQNGNFNQEQQQQQYQRHYSSGPETYYEQNCEKNEIVFGAVQEQDGPRKAMVIRAVDYADPMYDNLNIQSRHNHTDYSYGY